MDPVTEAVNRRTMLQTAQAQKSAREALERRPEVRELRAFLASPAGAATARVLLEEFVLASPRGESEFLLGAWVGAGEVARWLLTLGGRDPAPDSK